MGSRSVLLLELSLPQGLTYASDRQSLMRSQADTKGALSPGIMLALTCGHQRCRNQTLRQSRIGYKQLPAERILRVICTTGFGIALGK